MDPNLLLLQAFLQRVGSNEAVGSRKQVVNEEKKQFTNLLNLQLSHMLRGDVFSVGSMHAQESVPLHTTHLEQAQWETCPILPS